MFATKKKIYSQTAEVIATTFFQLDQLFLHQFNKQII